MPRTCPDCGRQHELKRVKCHACYRREWIERGKHPRKKFATCACGKPAKVKTTGQCSACYSRDWRAANPDRARENHRAANDRRREKRHIRMIAEGRRIPSKSAQEGRTGAKKKKTGKITPKRAMALYKRMAKALK